MGEFFKSKMNSNSFLKKSILYDWIPDFAFHFYDLSELVVLAKELEEECIVIADHLNAFLAIYKKGTRAKPKGLCTTFQYASLNSSELELCQKLDLNLQFSMMMYICEIYET
ncbi:Hypothetical protein LBF_4218 [Leptospira biflexa serovar Patoc strain 'Patoc 1 (Ames)']|nr:Hypothetical protein LBF_4218 [Leptospira biflexa serovar Patoc strain 'Patoc 1 (Ames)']